MPRQRLKRRCRLVFPSSPRPRCPASTTNLRSTAAASTWATRAPFGPATARRLLGRLAIRRLLNGYRGASAVDLEALCATIARFSVLTAELGDVVGEIDVNPLICTARTAVAVDALVVPRPRA